MRKVFLLAMVFVVLVNSVAWAKLNEKSLKQSVAERVRVTLKGRVSGVENFGPDKVKIEKKKKVKVGKYELYAVKLQLMPFKKGQKLGEMSLLVDSSGKIAFPDVQDISKGQSLVEDAMDEINRIELDKNFGEVFFKGKGKHEVVFISDPFCPYCRRAFNYLAGKKDEMKEWKIVHMPLSFHRGANVATWVMEYAHDKNIKFQDVVKVAYNGLSMPREKDLQKAEKAVLKQFANKFPELGFKDIDKVYSELKQQYDGKVKQNIKIANSLGVRGTPGIFIDGIKVRGFNKPKIEKILAKK